MSSIDPVKEIQELKADRDNLKKELTKEGLDKDEKIAIRNEIIAIDNQITELYKHLANKPETKTIMYVEDGEKKVRALTREGFRHWCDHNISSLIPKAEVMAQLSEGADAETAKVTEVCEWDLLDESTVYIPQNNYLDTKAALQHVIDTYELEFGTSLEQLLHKEPSWKRLHLNAVINPLYTKKKKLSINPYLCQVRDDNSGTSIEIDFVAKSRRNGSALVGAFSMMPPPDKKLKKMFAHDIPLLARKGVIPTPNPLVVIGVALGHPEQLFKLMNRQFESGKIAKCLVRHSKGFVPL